MRTVEVVIRNALYTFAFIMAAVAVAMMAASILPSLLTVRSNGLAAFVLLRVVTGTAPLSMALAVVSLCLAVAFDRLIHP